MSKIVSIIGHKGAGKDTAAAILIDEGYTNIKFAGALKNMIRFALVGAKLDDQLIHALLEGDLKEVPSIYLSRQFFMRPQTQRWMLAGLLAYQGWSNTRILRVIDQNLFTPIPELEDYSPKHIMESLFLEWTPHLQDDANTPRWVMQSLGTEWGRNCIASNIWVNVAVRAAQSEERVVFTDARFHNEVGALKDAGAIFVRINRPGLEIDLSHESERVIPEIECDFEVINDGTVGQLQKRLMDTVYRK